MIEPVLQREDSLETRLSISTETVPSPSLMSTLSGYSTPSSLGSSFSLSPQSSVSPTFRPVAVPQVQPVAVGSVQMSLESECTVELIKYCDEVIQHALTVKDYYGQ